jgi:fibronectin type 3 domain-containing protein
MLYGLLILSLGCVNPNGDSVVSTDHTPLLKLPDAFGFKKISALPDGAVLTWSSSERASSYKVYMGFNPDQITNLVSSCATSALSCTVSNLAKGTTFYFKIYAYNASGNTPGNQIGIYSSVGAFNISSHVQDDRKITLTWTDSEGASAYNVVYGTQSGSYTDKVSNVTSPYTINNLNNGVTYYIRIESQNSSNGYSLSGNELSAKPIGRPLIPDGLVATAKPGQIGVTWNAVPGATSYKIFKGTASGNEVMVASNLTTARYTDTSVANGSTYFYYVKAFNGYDSFASNVVSARPIAAFNLDSVAVGPGSMQLTITWPTTVGASTYDLIYGIDSSNLDQILTDVTSPVILSDLSGASTYYFKILAKNSVGLGTYQNSTNTLFAMPIAPTNAPSSLTTVATPGQVLISWPPVTGALKYELFRGTTAGNYTSIKNDIVGSSFVDTTTVNGVSYYYVIRAFNGLYSELSSEVVAKAIQSFSISSLGVTGPNSLLINWANAAGAESYDLLYGTMPGSYSTTITGVTPPFNLSGLNPNTIYYVVVRATNSVGTGTVFQSSQSQALTSTVAPTGLTASSIPGKVTLNWSSVAGASSYRIYRGTSSGSYSLIASSITATTYADTSVSNGSTYFYAVSASNGTESSKSNEVTIKPISAFTISSLTATTTTTMTVTWPNVLGAESYNILYGTTTGDYTTTLTNKTSPSVLTNINPGTTYYVRVVATNSVGNGSSQNSSESSSLTPVDPPSEVVATAGVNTIDLSWSGVTGASSYKIYRGTTPGTYNLLASNIVATSYSDSSAIIGTAYYYAVQSFNGVNSLNSSETAAKMIASFAVTSLSSVNQNSLQVIFPTTLGGETYDVKYGTTPGTYSVTQPSVTSPYIITGLTPNTTYYAVIQAKNTTGLGGQRLTAEVSLKTAPDSPASLVATAASNSVQLSWGASAGASSYKIYRGTTTGNYTLLSSTPSSPYTDSTAVSGTTYFYAVKASNGSDSTYSNEVFAKSIAAFAITLTSPTANQFQVNWTAPSGSSSVDILYGTTSGSYTTTLSAQTSPLVITGLSENTTYYVIARATNNVGSGATVNSAQVSLKTPPLAPTSLVATAGAAQVGLNWSPVTGAADYKVFRGTVSGALTQIGTSSGSTAYLDTTVVSGTTYFYAVKSTNGNDSVYSNQITVRPISAFTLSSAVAASTSSVNLVWTTATGATSYEVQYGTSSGVYLASITGVTSPYTLTGLNPNTTYYISIKASNTVYAGTAVSSNERIVATPTSAPSSLTASASPGQTLLNWSSVTGATSYNIYRGTTSGTYSLIKSANVSLDYTDTTIIDGTQYYYVVRAFNGSESANSSEATARSISTVTVTSTAPTSSTLQLTWAAPTGGQTYDVLYGTTTGVYTTISNVTSPYTITGLTENTLYYFVVNAKNTIGLGSSRQSAEGSKITPTSAPSLLTSSAIPGSVTLNWQPVAGATSYKVYRGTTSGSYTLIASSVVTNSYQDSTVSNGSTYYYVVKASNGSDSANSNESPIRPIGTFLLTSADDASTTSLRIVWPTATGATSYDIIYGTSSGNYTETVTNQVSPAIISGLATGTIYYVKVVAKNTVGSGTSVNSDELSATTGFGAPTNLKAQSLSSGTVSLNWKAITGASSYKVFRGTNSGSYTLLSDTVASNTYTDSTAVDGTVYFYVVQASDGTTDSANSNEATIKSIATSVISSVSPSSATSMTIQWPALAGSDSYDIKYGTTSGTYSNTLTGVSSPYLLSGLTAATTYYFILVAKNTTGPGTTQTSTEVSAKTSTSAPSTLVATATTGQIALTWTAAANATNYNIYRGTSTGNYTQIASAITPTNYTDTTITDGTIYFYAVKAFNGSESAFSNESSAQSVASFAITSTSAPTTTSIQVTWPTTLGASSYDILFGTTSGSLTSTALAVTSPYTLTGLLGGTNYYIVVRAKNVIGVGSNTQTAEVIQKTPLSNPTGLAATSSSGSVSLSWTPVTGATNYNIYRGTVSGTYSSIATAVSGANYVDSTVSNGTVYYYVVRAFNGAESAASNQATTKPIASFAIDTISSVTSNSLQVSWTPTEGADSYDVKYGTVSGTYTTTFSNVSSPYTVTGLTANTTYYLVVTARNSTGSGTTLNSSVSSGKTASSAPTGLIATATASQVGLNWTAVAGASSYHVFRGTVSGSLSLLSSGVLTNAFMDTTITAGTTYYYAVQSFNGATSAASSQVSVQPISSFTLTAATAASSSSMNLSWTSATGATSYDVLYGTSMGVYLSSVTGVSSPYVLTGLTAGTTYYVAIRAKNLVGSGTNLNSNELNAKTAAGAPSSLTASAVPGTVTLGWTSVSGATNYNIYRGTTSGTYSQIASAISTNSYVDNTVSNGENYYYVVRAFNGIESANSNEALIKPIGTFSPLTAASGSASSIILTFSAQGGDAYNVSYGTVSGSYTTTLTNKTSPLTISGLSASTRYYFYVRASNSTGSGTALNSSEINQITATLAPTGLTASATPGQINISWSIVPGANTYNLYRGTTSGDYAQIASAVSTTNYVDTTILNGTTYYYVLRAYNGSESANSNEVSTSAIEDFSITSTTGLSMTSIQVIWPSVPGASAYDVRYGTTSGSYTVTKSNVTSPYTITGLTAGTRYYIVVKARNSLGGGSATTSGEVAQITPLEAPSSLVATAGAGIVNLSWNLVTGASSYKIMRGTTSGVYSEIAAGVSGNSYSDTTVTNGSTYYYAVKSFNDADSANSSEVFKRPMAQPVISSIDDSISSQSLKVNWDPVVGAETYDINYGTASGSYTFTSSNVVSGQIISGLTAGQKYFMRVQAKNTIGGGSSVNGIESNAETNAPPVMSTILTKTMEANTTSNVNFNLSDNNNLLSCSGSMSASSSDTSILSNSKVIFSGTLPTCVIAITPEADKTGTVALTITATDGISPVSQTFNVVVNPCTVSSIVWETQPVGMAAGNLFATAPRVSLRQANNSLCTTNLSPVNLEISNDTSIQQDAKVTGIASEIPSGGYAIFDRARMLRAGAGMTLIATQDSASSLDSNAFSVSALAASKIIFSQQPLTTNRNVSMTPAPQVRVTDIYDNYITSENVSVTLSLEDNTEGATLGGTLTQMTTSGIATFSNLSINTIGSYYLKATPSPVFGAINSSTFEVRNILALNSQAVIEQIQGVIIGGSGAKKTYPRSAVPMGTNFIDGSSTYSWKIIATNTSTTQASTVRLLVGTNSVASITVPTNTTTPTMFSSTVSNSSITASANWSVRLELGTPTVYSSRIAVKQLNATRSQVYIPLTSMSNASSTTMTTTSTTMNVPNDLNFPPYTFTKSKFSRLDSAQLVFSGYGTGGNACIALYNKTNNTMIGSELCTSSTTETLESSAIPLTSLPNSADLEIRMRASAGTANLYKAGLLLRLVGIKNTVGIQRVAPAVTALSSSTSFVEQRSTSFVTGFDSLNTNEYVTCTAKATSSGSGSFTFMDHGLNNSGTTSASVISASTNIFSNQSTLTQLEAGPIATTDGNNMFMSFLYNSGSFSLGHCLLETEATY